MNVDRCALTIYLLLLYLIYSIFPPVSTSLIVYQLA
jgi:hypothetical protein